MNLQTMQQFRLQIPYTRVKIRLAGLLKNIIRLAGVSTTQLVKRDGIYFQLDLNEGIDFSVFLLGNFQSHIFKTHLVQMEDGKTIIDVGANIGNMALRFARQYPHSTVYAFEPTHYALTKLRNNLALNPSLANRITVTHSFISDQDTAEHNITAYSSWEIGRHAANKKELHPIHLGKIMSADGVPAVQLDSFCEKLGISNIGLIKIDTDGHEPYVLKGAERIISQQQPFIVFELGDYLMQEKKITFDFYLKYFGRHNYTLVNMSSEEELTPDSAHNIIPHYGGIDVLAIPPRADKTCFRRS